jgi:putative oxidoreductase
MLSYEHILFPFFMQDTCCNDKTSCGCTKNGLNTAGRILFSIPFLLFGMAHFTSGPMMTASLEGWPFALFFVYLSGAGLILGALAIILNRCARIAATLLAVEIGMFILGIHVPGILANPATAQMSIMFTLKDVALLGGALVIASSMSNRGFTK